jgi:hypothetical protein
MNSRPFCSAHFLTYTTISIARISICLNASTLQSGRWLDLLLNLVLNKGWLNFGGLLRECLSRVDVG